MTRPKLLDTRCFWLLSCLPSISALAQTLTGTSYPPVQVVDSPLQYRQFEKVEITGSSIVRKQQTQALPVHVYTREELFRSGLRTVADVIQKLPEMGQMVESGQLTQITGGYSAASIHGLRNGTLILVNGLRLAPYGRATTVGPERSTVDLNTIPMADIDRIEILSDGASSLYGSDALAGVINIILRQERRGFEITADKIMPKGGSGGNGYITSLSWGAGDLRREGYSFLVTAELAHKNELIGGDRPYASKGRYVFEQGGRTWQADSAFPLSLNYTSPATLMQIASPTSARTFVNAYSQNGQCAPNTLKIAGQSSACAKTWYPDLGIYPEEDSKRLHARAQWALPNSTVFVDALYGQHQSSIAANVWNWSWSGLGQAVGSTGYQAALAAGLDPAKTYVLWQPNLSAIRERYDTENTRLAMGIKGEWQAWDYQSSAYLARNAAQSYNQHPSAMFYDNLGLGRNQNWTRTEVLQPLTASNPLTAELYALRGDYKMLSSGHTDIRAWEIRASRALWEIDGKDVLLGIGADWRQEASSYQRVEPDYIVQQPSFSASRQVKAAYAELQVPVTADWEIMGALRSDVYSDVGTTHNGKLSSRWAISPQWSVRGSMGTGFRAPSLAQLNETDQPFLFSRSGELMTCSLEQKAIAARLKTAAGESGQCAAGQNPLVFGTGNTRLRPETSKQESLGLAFVPHANLRMALDVWRIQISDTIRYTTAAAILNNPTRYAKNYMLTPGNVGSQGDVGNLALFTQQENVGRTEKSGIDLEVQWRQPIDWGRLNLSAKATYMLRSVDQADAAAEVSSDLGRFSSATGTVTPRVQARIMGGLTRGAWTTTLVLQHVSGYTDAPIQATDLATGSKENVTRQVRSFTTLDAFATWAVEKNVSLNLGVRNVFDQDAPQTFASSSIQVFGASTRHANLWGRTLQLGVTARF